RLVRYIRALSPVRDPGSWARAGNRDTSSPRRELKKQRSFRHSLFDAVLFNNGVHDGLDVLNSQTFRKSRRDVRPDVLFQALPGHLFLLLIPKFGYKDPFAPPRMNQALAFEIFISPLHGDHTHALFGCKPPNRREALAGFHFSGKNPGANLPD